MEDGEEEKDEDEVEEERKEGGGERQDALRAKLLKGRGDGRSIIHQPLHYRTCFLTM